MTHERERLERLAAGIVDGEDIDWKEATRDDDPESTRSKIESLHTVIQLREFAVSLSDRGPIRDEPSDTASPTKAQESLDRTVILRIGDTLSAWVQRLRRGGRG
jgi:hypothetical protein